jgi:hypothetical protein
VSFSAQPGCLISDTIETEASPMSHSATCGHCEDKEIPVTSETGITIDYVARPPVLIKISLHHACAATWCSDFGLPAPGKPFDLRELRGRIKRMSNGDLTRFETHARYMLTPNAQRPVADYEQELHEAHDEWRRRHLKPSAIRDESQWVPELRHS